MLITIGRHKGKDTKDLSSYYLGWLLVQLEEEPFYNEKLITACHKELEYRLKNDCHFGDD